MTENRRSLTISGFATCGAYKQARDALLGMKALFPKEWNIELKEFPTRDEYMEFLATFRETLNQPNHKTSPIVWFNEGTEGGGNKYLGGRDDTVAWLRTQLPSAPAPAGMQSSQQVITSVTSMQSLTNVDNWNPNHSYDYDLIVIGGGSGGLACSKEAIRLGAKKVAVLDFVKPSPHGTKWGLGGTCVNVGCIPKKLMHFGAQLGEFQHTSKSYGWQVNGESEGNANKTNMTNHWETFRDHIQDHIKSLNFGYRVDLREKGVTYLNKLGKFIDDHTLEVVDNKGNKSQITAARFVIATGGRPTPLAIPGGEHAITSDDLFSLPKPPGKTCMIGAGYISLECGGFIAGLGYGEVVVLVRSRPLRSFDADTVNYVIDYMQKLLPIRIENAVLPKSIEKLPNGRYLVCFGDGMNDKCEEFDTVLVATGRTPDIKGLNLQALSSPGIKIHEKSGKIVTENEQTTVPHIYAIGDCIHNAPELTPSAILAGKLLARRLFGHINNNGTIMAEYMNYKNIATAVFTPLELGTVGLTEDEAKNQYGDDNIDCYISAFKPLEWALSNEHHEVNAYIKVIFHKGMNNKIVGMHIASPNAGEIIQGYGLAMNKGLSVEELLHMVGIHPTVAEEFTTLNITKSSGQSIAKTGC